MNYQDVVASIPREFLVQVGGGDWKVQVAARPRPYRVSTTDGPCYECLTNGRYVAEPLAGGKAVEFSSWNLDVEDIGRSLRVKVELEGVGVEK